MRENQAEITSSRSQWFCLDQMHFRLSVSTADLMTQLARFWQESFFLTPTSANPKGGLSATICLGSAATRPVVQGPPIYCAASLTVEKSATGFLLSAEESWLAIEPGAQRAEGRVVPEFWSIRPQDQRDFFLLAFLMLSHRQGYYGLHANALSDGTCDYLIVGPSGSGKSTLTVQLCGLGWQCGGDDLLLLHRGQHEPEAIRALALRRDFALSQRTISAICMRGDNLPNCTDTAYRVCTKNNLGHCKKISPARPWHSTQADCSTGQLVSSAGDVCRRNLLFSMALDNFPPDPKQNQREKQIVTAAVAAATALKPQFAPERLIFSIIVDAAESTLHPMQPAAALIALSEQSAGIMMDRVTGQAQFHLLAQLVQSVPSYQLALGRDLLTHPVRVADRLRAIL